MVFKSVPAQVMVNEDEVTVENAKAELNVGVAGSASFGASPPVFAHEFNTKIEIRKATHFKKVFT